MRVIPTLLQRNGASSSSDRNCISLPKEILPRRISSAYGILVLYEGLLEHLPVLEAAGSHDIPWQTGWVSREWLRL